MKNKKVYKNQLSLFDEYREQNRKQLSLFAFEDYQQKTLFCKPINQQQTRSRKNEYKRMKPKSK